MSTDLLGYLHLSVRALITVVIALMHLLGIIAAFHAIRYARTSQGAAAWAISLVSLPYLTLVPYCFLGSSRFFGYVDARRLRNLQMRQRIPQPEWEGPKSLFRNCRERVRDLRGRSARTGVYTDDHEDSEHRPTPYSGRLPCLWTGSKKFTKLKQPANGAARLGRQHARSLAALANMPFLPGNRVELLINGDSTFSAIFAAIERASRYLMLQFFVVRDDDLGQKLQQALLKKAALGVRVYFLYDGIGCSELSSHYVNSLRAGGVEVHRFATRRFINRFQLNFRNHRKIVIIDGQRAFVGGHNVGDEYLGKKPPLSPWRDTHIEVEGSVVSAIQSAFIQDWFWATQRLPLIALPQPHDANMHCLVIASGPADRHETCSLFFVEAINAACQRIWIATPYFVPDEAVFAALRLAVMRGVDTRILLPSQSDHFGVFHASMWYAHDAVRAGIRIFRYRPGFLHQKVILIDDIAAAIGTANLDNRSFRLNFEMMVLTVNDSFAAKVGAMLSADFAQADPVRLTEVTQARAWRRAAMDVARLFSPLL